MPGAAPSPTVVRFGVFDLDLRAGELRKQGLKVKLQEKPQQVLAILLEKPGEVVTREELRQRLWGPDTFVDFDHSLGTAINKLREALGDSAESPRFIETLPRHGYRFIGSLKSSESHRVRTVPEEPQPVRAEPELRAVPDRPPAERSPAAGVRMRQAVLAGPRGRLFLYIAGILVAAIAIATGGAGVYRYFRPVPKTPAPPMKVVPLTSFPGNERDPSFSPDGNQIAFAWNGENEDNWDIYVKVIGTESVLRLTTNPAIDRSPAWSPDGRYIAFHRHAGSEDGIYLIPALGGPERKLYSVRLEGIWNFERLDWSRDGKSLAFSEKRPDERFVRISVLSVETLEKRAVNILPPPEPLGDRHPRYSPDGRTLAVMRGYPSTRDLCIVPAEGGEAKRLTYNTDLGGHAWTPDGAHLIYSADRGGVVGLWKLSLTGGKDEKLPVGTENAVEPALSKDGRRLAYVRELEDVNIWRFEVPRTPDRATPPTRLIASTQYDGSQQFSPDGKRIVFASARTGNLPSTEIWVSDSDGSKPIRLTHFGGPMAGTPRWSPDGRQIVFDCDAGGNADIYVVGAEGGPPRRLTTESSNDYVPSWSRDGRWIYFGSDRTGAWQVWKMPAEGGKAVQVTKRGGFAAFESYDGKTLYYAKGQNAPGLWKMPAGGGQETLMLGHLLGGLWGYWSLTQKGIYFYDAGTKAIEFYSFASRKVAKVLTPEKGPAYIYPGLSVSPDGRWILYTQVDTRSSNIMLVENFRW